MNIEKKKLLPLIIILLLVVVILCTVSAALLLYGNGGGTVRQPSAIARPVIKTDDKAPDAETLKALVNGCAPVTDYGAVPGDGKDDTDAFKKAAALGYGVYVPGGTYELSDTIQLSGQLLCGDGEKFTVIHAMGDKTLLSLTGDCVVNDLTLAYTKASGDDGKEIAITVSGDGTSRAALINRVTISNAGTGVLVNGKKTQGMKLDNVRITGFGYAGVRLEKGASSNTILRDLALSDSKAKYGIMLSDDLGTLLDKVTVVNSDFTEQAVCFDGSIGADIKTLNAESVNAKSIAGGKAVSAVLENFRLSGCKGDACAVEGQNGAITPYNLNEK